MKAINYEKQAQDFLQSCGAKLETKFLYHGQYFESDKDTRDVYEVIVSRPGKSIWSFKFGQSIANSSKERKRKHAELWNQGKWSESKKYSGQKHPTAYDILACLQKNDIGTFEQFCGNFGYSTDSRSAERLYFEVQKEVQNCLIMFGDVIDQLQEIR